MQNNCTSELFCSALIGSGYIGEEVTYLENYYNMVCRLFNIEFLRNIITPTIEL